MPNEILTGALGLAIIAALIAAFYVLERRTKSVPRERLTKTAEAPQIAKGGDGGRSDTLRAGTADSGKPIAADRRGWSAAFRNVGPGKAAQDVMHGALMVQHFHMLKDHGGPSRVK